MCYHPSAFDPLIIRCGGMRIEYQDCSGTLGQCYSDMEKPLFIDNCHDGVLFKHDSNNDLTCVAACIKKGHSRSDDTTFFGFNEIADP